MSKKSISKIVILVIIILAAIVGGIYTVMSLERIDEGYVGVVYTYSEGVQDSTLDAGMHFVGPFAKVKEFPISQQQLVLSNSPEDYNDKEHPDWSIDAPANGGMVTLNVTVNYNFMPDRVVGLYKRFKGMDGETIVESRVQNSIIAYIKEVTPKYSVMDIYSDKRAEVSSDITKYLNTKLGDEYGINISSALIIDVQLNDTLKAKIQAKEEAKQDAEKAELDRQTAQAQAEVTKVNAETTVEVERIETEAAAEQTRIKAQASADATRIKAEAEAEANAKIAQSLTPELIEKIKYEKWNGELPTVQGSDSTIVDIGDVTNSSDNVD